MAKTGETRKTKQPLKIDRLPPSVHEAILTLRNKLGKTWQEIEELSAEPFGKNKSGFVDWENLPAAVLELFPDMRIPRTNLHRWYDLRVSQVQQQVMESSERARVLAAAFAKASVAGDREGVMNAARDLLMTVLSEDGTAGGKLRATKALLALAEVMQTARANDIKERRVAADERKLRIVERREKAAIVKLEAEAEKLKKKAVKGVVTPEDMDRLRERVFGLPPKAEAAE